MAARVCGRYRAADELLQHLSKPLRIAMNVVVARQQPHRQLNSSRARLGLVVLQHVAEHAVHVKELPGWRWHLGVECWRLGQPGNR